MAYQQTQTQNDFLKRVPTPASLSESANTDVEAECRGTLEAAFFGDDTFDDERVDDGVSECINASTSTLEAAFYGQGPAKDAPEHAALDAIASQKTDLQKTEAEFGEADFPEQGLSLPLRIATPTPKTEMAFSLSRLCDLQGWANVVDETLDAKNSSRTSVDFSRTPSRTQFEISLTLLTSKVESPSI